MLNTENQTKGRSGPKVLPLKKTSNYASLRQWRECFDIEEGMFAAQFESKDQEEFFKQLFTIVVTDPDFYERGARDSSDDIYALLLLKELTSSVVHLQEKLDVDTIERLRGSLDAKEAEFAFAFDGAFLDCFFDEMFLAYTSGKQIITMDRSERYRFTYFLSRLSSFAKTLSAQPAEDIVEWNTIKRKQHIARAA